MIQFSESAKQIPEWMSVYLINPPEWILILLGGIALVISVIALVGLIRSGMSEEIVREMVTNLTYLLCCGTASWITMATVPGQWPVAAALGCCTGVAIAHVLVPQFHLAVEDAFEDARSV
jgi:hypothetical protein